MGNFRQNQAHQVVEHCVWSVNLNQVMSESWSNQILSYRSTKAFLDPCLPSDCAEQRTFKGKEYTFLGTGLYTECQKVILPLLNLSKPCPRQPCSFNGVYQPKIDYTKDEFYGFSEYWYSMNDVLRIGGQYRAAHMKQTVEVGSIDAFETRQNSFL